MPKDEGTHHPTGWITSAIADSRAALVDSHNGFRGSTTRVSQQFLLLGLLPVFTPVSVPVCLSRPLWTFLDFVCCGGLWPVSLVGYSTGLAGYSDGSKLPCGANRLGCELQDSQSAQPWNLD